MQALKNAKAQRIALPALSSIIVILELEGLRLSIRAFGLSLVQFYTQDSNLLALAANGVLLLTLWKRGESGTLPLWVSLLNYMAVCCLAVTFVVVVCVLSPMEGGYALMLLSGSMLYHHLLCPLLMLFAFIVLEPAPGLTKKHALIALAPTCLYAAATIVLNLTGALDGPYPFLRITVQPPVESAFWFLTILGGAYAIARLILWANHKCALRVMPVTR